MNALLYLGVPMMAKFSPELNMVRSDAYQMISELSHRVVHEPIEGRANDNKLTGEWMVFAKHNQKNYYLCCNTHNAGDQMIFDRIESHCPRDFPFLSALLASANA
jgi:hypothetical protein